MWTHLLISLCILKFDLVFTYYQGSSYYPAAHYYPQFYALNNDAPLICFIYFPGFVYYPQSPTQRDQYPVLAPFYGQPVYQTFSSYPNADSESRSSKPNVEQSKKQFGSEHPLSVIGVPVIITNVNGELHTSVKDTNNSLETTQASTTNQQSYSEKLNVDTTTHGPWLFQDKNTEEPQQKITTEQSPDVPIITLPIFITQTRTSKQPVHEISTSTTTEATQMPNTITEFQRKQSISTTLSGKEWDNTESSIVSKEHGSEKQLPSHVTEFPKEWFDSVTGHDIHLAATTENQSDGSGSGDGSIPIDDEDGF